MVRRNRHRIYNRVCIVEKSSVHTPFVRSYFFVSNTGIALQHNQEYMRLFLPRQLLLNFYDLLLCTSLHLPPPPPPKGPTLSARPAYDLPVSSQLSTALWTTKRMQTTTTTALASHASTGVVIQPCRHPCLLPAQRPFRLPQLVSLSGQSLPPCILFSNPVQTVCTPWTRNSSPTFRRVLSLDESNRFDDGYVL